MVKINIPMPASCNSCPFKGARLCYIATWLGTEYREVPEEGRAEWCPMEEAVQCKDCQFKDSESMYCEAKQRETAGECFCYWGMKDGCD